MTHADESGVAAFGGAARATNSERRLISRSCSVMRASSAAFFGGIFAAEIAIIPFVNLHFVGGFVDEEGFCRDSVEELDVVRNDKNGSGVVTKIIHDEGFGFDVEVVGRFVEEK